MTNAGYQEITERLEELGIVRLSDDTGTSVNEITNGATIHDNLQAHTPRTVFVLTDDEMWKLVAWWLDGHCACGEEIPSDHVTCRDCAEQAARAWSLLRS
jgi:hypothetical protein